MKHVLPVFLFLLTLSTAFAQKTIYVKHDAAGANDGTSWANAYTTLYTALSAAAPGDQVWVAAGTYKADAGVANNSLFMEAGVALYGGFNGTEAMLSARNPQTNVTVLSGDLGGDDIVGDFASNRADNSIHVLEVLPSAEPADRAVVDGFTISGGNTTVGASNPAQTRTGGGIMVGAKLTASNCLFTDNSGDYGGSLAATDDVAGSLLVENCIFEKNTTTLQSAGIYLSGLVSGATVKKCVFRENATIRGCMYVIASADLVIDSCLFENNNAGANPCAGVYTWQTPFTLTNSTFKGNVSTRYSAMYNDGRDDEYPFTIDNCLFESNSGIDATASPVGGAVFNNQPSGVIKNSTFKSNLANRGGGIYNSGTSTSDILRIENCVFEENSVTGSSSRGGGMYNTSANLEIRGCTFLNNISATSAGSAIHNGFGTVYYIFDCEFSGGNAGFGGAVGNYDAGTFGTYEECSFLGNTAATSGGAITNGFTATTNLKNCLLSGNSARFGGSIYAQNASTTVNVEGCTITENSASDNGGGIFMSGGNILNMDSCVLEVNVADIGGAIYVLDDTLNSGSAVIRNTIIRNNFCNTQAAGLNVSNTDVLLENVLFVINQNFGDGAGGAISNNASATTNGTPSTSPIKAVNCTFADNVGTLGGGIAQWTDGTATATLELQNCILANNLLSNYEVEDGTPTVVSLGGNLCTDATLTSVLTGINDLLSLDPLFVDPTIFDYHLQAGSPCIDKGVATDAPATDLDGNPRDSNPDQGAYEFQTSGTHFAHAQVLPLRLLPNPTVDRAILVLEDNWSGDARVQIVAQNGAVVQSFMANKIAGRWVQPIDVRNLPAGIYSVQVQAGTAFYEGGLVKR
ncbi:MAG: T9SS type A sorting domain-containing protein [Lewinellaceae bacterium]|nr:T9SS type A sorting domain-containing protein [Saprospiraceae bacterium]MCB9330226.1 T9SS type A sorting domain-containing protein [Lewinellaceae bacterium]